MRALLFKTNKTLYYDSVLTLIFYHELTNGIFQNASKCSKCDGKGVKKRAMEIAITLIYKINAIPGGNKKGQKAAINLMKNAF